MVQHRKKLGKNQRVRRKEKRRRDAQATAEAGTKLSAMKTYFPSSVSEAAKTFGVSNNEQSEGLNVALENQKRAKKLKQKITKGQFDDHHRRLKLLELHVEAAANIFNKIKSNHEVLSDHIAKDLRNLIRNFSAACADGRDIRSTTNDAMTRVTSLETAVSDLEATMENLEASLEDLTAASAKQAQSIDKIQENNKPEMASTREMFDAAVNTMEERMSAIESQVEKLVKSASTSAAQQSANQPKDDGVRKVWQGRLRSGKKG